MGRARKAPYERKGGLIMSKLSSAKWWKAAGIRAIKTIAQTTVALIPAGVMIQEVNWIMVLGTAALAGVLSLLTSLAGLPEVTD